MTLGQLLKPQDLQRVQAKFSFDVASVPVEWGRSDGQFNRMASAVSDGLFSSTGYIRFDPSDFPRSEQIDMDDPLKRETVFHELYHLLQFRRGFWYRLKIKWWKLTKSYEDRPHEKEAHERGHSLANNW